MKKASYFILTFFAVLLTGVIAHGQQANTTDSRISEVYVGYVKDLNAEQLNWIKNELSRSEIKKEAYSKDEKYPLLSSLPLVNKYNSKIAKDDFSKPTEINPIKYKINFMNEKDQVFRIDGTDYILYVKGK